MLLTLIGAVMLAVGFIAARWLNRVSASKTTTLVTAGLVLSGFVALGLASWLVNSEYNAFWALLGAAIFLARLYFGAHSKRAQATSQ